MDRRDNKKKVLSSGGSRRLSNQLNPSFTTERRKDEWLIDSCIYKADKKFSNSHCGKRCKNRNVSALKCRGGCGCEYYLSTKEWRLSKKGKAINLKEESGLKK